MKLFEDLLDTLTVDDMHKDAVSKIVTHEEELPESWVVQPDRFDSMLVFSYGIRPRDVGSDTLITFHKNMLEKGVAKLKEYLAAFFGENEFEVASVSFGASQTSKDAAEKMNVNHDCFKQDDEDYFYTDASFSVYSINIRI